MIRELLPGPQVLIPAVPGDPDAGRQGPIALLDPAHDVRDARHAVQVEGAQLIAQGAHVPVRIGQPGDDQAAAQVDAPGLRPGEEKDFVVRAGGDDGVAAHRHRLRLGTGGIERRDRAAEENQVGGHVRLPGGAGGGQAGRQERKRHGRESPLHGRRDDSTGPQPRSVRTTPDRTSPPPSRNGAPKLSPAMK